VERPLDRDLGVHGIIEAQRRSEGSARLSDAFIGAMRLAAKLRQRLARLTDRQVGQLVRDVVADGLRVLSPEMEICEDAARRLFRSGGGRWAEQDASVGNETAPPCPACGAETICQVGIDEPDFLLCASADCQHKEPLGIGTDDSGNNNAA